MAEYADTFLIVMIISLVLNIVLCCVIKVVYDSKDNENNKIVYEANSKLAIARNKIEHLKKQKKLKMQIKQLEHYIQWKEKNLLELKGYKMRITKKDEFKAAIAAQLMIIYSSDTQEFILESLRKYYKKEIRENECYEHPLGIEISFLIGLIFCFSLFILCYKGFSILNILIACFIIFICILLFITYHFYVRNKRIRFWYYGLLYERLRQRLEKNKGFKGEKLYKLVADETMQIIQIL